jgi:hypothetical protein
VAKAKAPKRKREETEAPSEEGASLTAKEKNQAKKARQQANREKKDAAVNSKGEDAETIARKASKKARQKERQKSRKEAGVENKWSTKKPDDEKKTEEALKVKKVKVAKENTHANQTVVQMAKGVQMVEKTVGKGVVLTKGSKVAFAIFLPSCSCFSFDYLASFSREARIAMLTGENGLHGAYW